MRNSKMASTPVKIAVKQVKPLLSINHADARRRTIALYKTWYRLIPTIAATVDMPVSETQMREKLRELFRRHDNVTDLRVIDLLIIKGQQDLLEAAMGWRHKGSLMSYWNESQPKRPTDFMGKFFSGHE